MPDAAVLAAPATATPDRPPNAGGAHDDAFAKMDRIAVDDTPPAKAAPAKQPPKQDAPKADKPTTPPQDKAAKPPEAKPDDKPADTTPVEKMAPKALREAYSSAKQQLKAAQAELAQVKNAAPKEFKVAEAPEFKSLQEKLQAVQKRADELEETVKFTNYEQSKEYQEKYQVPFQNTLNSAVNTAKQFKISPEDGSPDRLMTENEFIEICRLSDENSAIDAAEALFGKGSAKAARIAQLRDQVITANDAAQKAKEDFKKNIGERTKQMQEQQEGFTKAQADAFTKHRDEAIAKYPQWFKADEGDAKGAELLEKGMAWADKAFSELPPEQAPKIHAALRNKAGAFDHVVHKLNSTVAQLKAAQEKLKAYESSKPGQGELPGTGAESDDPMGDTYSKFDKLAVERG